MSSFEDIAINPKTGKMEKAMWVDNAYGRHRYGVQFADGKTYHERNVKRVSSLELFTALNEAYERGQQDMRLKAQAAAFTARLPVSYRWGRDAMSQFNFGKNRARLAIAALPITPDNSEKEGGE